MARPSLGDRNRYTALIDARIDLTEVMRAHGYTTVTRFLNDVVAEKAGKPDLMFGPEVDDQPSLLAS